MAGPLTIQRTARGLLHALGMKGTGDLPHDLSQTLYPGFDCTPLYLLDNARSILDSTTSIAGAGVLPASGGTLTVPNGEMWLLTNFSLYCSILAAGNTNWKVQGGYVRKTAYSPILQSFGPSMNTFILADNFWVGWNFHVGDVILRAGDYLAAAVGGAGSTFGSNASIYFFGDYYRLEV